VNSHYRLFGDIRFAVRSLARNPGFTAAAVISLGLGIGASSAIFTVADQALVRLLPVKDPQRLVEFKWTGDFIGGSSRGLNDVFSYPAYVDLRDGNPGALTGIAARRQEQVDTGERGQAEQAMAEMVSGNYFDVLGVAAAIGRTLRPGDDKVKNGEPYVVLSYAYWQRRFGGDPSVLNRAIDINGHPMTVVGVAQRGFTGFEKVMPSDLFVPLMMKTAVTPTWDDMARRDSIWLNIFGRLRAGTDAKAAQSAMATPFHNVLRSDLAANERDFRFQKQYLADTLQLQNASQGLAGVGDSLGRPLLIISAMVGVLLLIACVNVANLLVTRSAARRKEIAVRLSLGATRGTLVRLVMTESLGLAVGGGLLALLCSAWTTSFLLPLVPGEQLDTAFRTTPDARILGFTALVSIVTALLFGLAPSFQASGLDPMHALRSESTRISMAASQRWFSRALVAAQVALSLTLLVAAGLFARSLYRLRSVDTGMQTSHLLQFTIAPSRHNYTLDRSRRLYTELQEGLRRLPGAVSASGVTLTILSGEEEENTVAVEGYHPRAGEDMNPHWNAALPGFFSTAGVPLIAGREFTERDSGATPRVLIVNESFVKRYLPNQNPIGRRIAWGGGGNPLDTEIVGVVRDFKAENPKDKLRPFMFSPALQNLFDFWTIPQMTFYVRATGAPKTLAQGARSILHRLDSSLPMFDVKTLDDQIGETNLNDRLFAVLSSAFAFLATLLASVGLYGVTSYAVARRTPEIGIRLALGADRTLIIRLILREVAGLTVVGMAAGIPLVLAFGRLAESHLYEVKGQDLGATLAAFAVIGGVSLVAGYLPARRVSRIDPTEALRNE